MSPDVVGYQDLDANGTWRIDATYGNVWSPNRVPAGWAPYRDGHWAWVDPWGWTWIDDAPWGFAVSHYGRWANFERQLGLDTRPRAQPRLLRPGAGRVRRRQPTSSSRFPAATSVASPGSRSGRARSIDRRTRSAAATSRTSTSSNTVINTTVINNTYNNINVTNVVYANRQVAGRRRSPCRRPTFVQSQPVSKAALRAPKELVASAPVAVAPPLAPTEKSVRGAAAQRDKPPARVFERPVVALSAPPVAHAGFAPSNRNWRPSRASRSTTRRARRSHANPPRRHLSSRS